MTDYTTNKRWRLKHPKKRQESTRRYYRKTAYAPNHNKRWRQREIYAVVLHGIPDSELSARIGRSTAAIQKVRWEVRRAN